MLARVAVSNKDRVLIPGASDGVGSALVKLAKFRGASVIALASEAKHTAVEKLGVDVVLIRHPANLKQKLQSERVTMLLDVVGGVIWAELIDILQKGGRYVCSGAIAGPLVEFDLRTFYLLDLTLLGSNVIDPAVTKNLIDYIEAGKIQSVLPATYPLRELRQAQTAFTKKRTLERLW